MCAQLMRFSLKSSVGPARLVRLAIDPHGDLWLNDEMLNDNNLLNRLIDLGKLSLYRPTFRFESDSRKTNSCPHMIFLSGARIAASNIRFY